MDAHTTPHEDSRASLEAARALVAERAGPRSTVLSTLLLVGAAGGGSLLAALWATEPEVLPVRTQVGFGLCLAVCAAWVVIAIARLRARGGYLARQRVFAAGLGLGASLVFTVCGALVSSHMAVPHAVWAVGVAGGTMVVVAAGLLLSAVRRLRAFEALRSAL